MYKRQVQKGKIADFKDSFEILSKIHWFERFSFEMREKLVNKADIVIYEPGLSSSSSRKTRCEIVNSVKASMRDKRS